MTDLATFTTAVCIKGASVSSAVSCILW